MIRHHAPTQHPHRQTGLGLADHLLECLEVSRFAENPQPPDAPIEDVVALIPFPPDMHDALVSRAGEKGALLEAVTALEAGDFDRAQRLVHGAGDMYLEALMWANEAAEPLFHRAQPAADRPRAA